MSEVLLYYLVLLAEDVSIHKSSENDQDWGMEARSEGEAICVYLSIIFFQQGHRHRPYRQKDAEIKDQSVENPELKDFPF